MPRKFSMNDVDTNAICLARGNWARLVDWAFNSIRVVLLNADGSESETYEQYQIPHAEVFYYSELDYALNWLVNARNEARVAKDYLEGFYAEIPAIKDGQKAQAEANRVEKAAAEYVRKVALHAVIAGNELDNGLKVEMRNKVAYDRRKALAWLVEHEPDLLSIDESKFAKLTKGMSDKTRAELEVKDYQEPFITIPSDLG